MIESDKTEPVYEEATLRSGVRKEDAIVLLLNGVDKTGIATNRILFEFQETIENGGGTSSTVSASAFFRALEVGEKFSELELTEELLNPRKIVEGDKIGIMRAEVFNNGRVYTVAEITSRKSNIPDELTHIIYDHPKK